MKNAEWALILVLFTAARTIGSAEAVDPDAMIGPTVSARVGPPRGDFGACPQPSVSLVLGTIDTIGGTTYDWQVNGPAYRMLANSSGSGLHALWMYSSSSQTTFPDRNMRYNFYDYAAQSWNWIDPDYMVSGADVFFERSGFGSLDANAATGCATVSCHQGSPGRPCVARDIASGAGLFEYCPGPSSLIWPPLAVSESQRIQVHMIDEGSREADYYSRVDPWCTWTSPMSVAPPLPYPMFPTHNVAASKVSPKVCLTWVNSPDETQLQTGYYRTSSDGGSNWNPPTELLCPDAFGPDTVESFHLSSLFPFYDRNDRLHIVASVAPVVNDTLWVQPAEIWHWCPNSNPAWSRIARAQTRHLSAPVGYNALYATRPSMGEDNDGSLFVAWEQFDSSNVEPRTNLLRADIFAARSLDDGQTWGTSVKLTSTDSTSHRFPSIVDLATDSLTDDFVHLTYVIDKIAGSFVNGQGPVTDNPVVVHTLRASLFPSPDVGVTSIISPTGTVDTGTVVTPRARVKNFGSAAASFPVVFRIGALYADTQTVDTLRSGADTLVGFDPWTARQRGSHAVKCSTMLAGDVNQENNARTDSVFVRVHDVGVVEIAAPPDSVDSGQVVIPEARVANLGTVSESFAVRFLIGTFYSNDTTLTLPAGDTGTATFATWVASPVGTHVVRCTTRLVGDAHPANDKVIDTVEVWPPVGVSESSELPASFGLAPARPSHSAQQRAVIRYALPRTCYARLRVLNPTGAVVRNLLARQEPAGYHSVVWDCLDDRGRLVQSGLYFVCFEAEGFVATRKVTRVGR